MNKIIKLRDEEYFESEGVSNSALLMFDRSASHMLNGLKETKSIKDGSLTHSFMLDDNYYDKYVIAPPHIENRVCKDYKEFNKTNPDSDIILYKDYEILSAIKENIEKYELINGMTYKQIVDQSQKEISVFWEYILEDRIIQKKAKLDLLYQGEEYNIIIDLKKTVECLDFQYAVRRYKLYRQAAWYIEGINYINKLIPNKKTIFIFLTFEYDPPHGVKAFMIDDEYRLLGDTENLSSLLNYIKWKDEGEKPLLYTEGVEIITKPSWLKEN